MTVTSPTCASLPAARLPAPKAPPLEASPQPIASKAIDAKDSGVRQFATRAATGLTAPEFIEADGRVASHERDMVRR